MWYVPAVRTVGRDTAPATVTAPVVSTPRKTRTVLVWAALGAFFAALQVYVYVSWVLSDQFKATDPGPSPLGASTHFWVVFFQIVSPLAAVALLAWVIRGCIRERRFTVDAMIVVVWAGLYWLDPFINVLRPQFLYNSHLFNRGSWVEHIPGWLSPNGHLLPEPLIFLGAIYLWMGPLATFMASRVMRRVRTRDPRASVLRTLATAWAVMVVFLLACELFFMRTGMYAYPLTIHKLSIWGGKTYQYPLAELFIWPMVWTSMASVRFFRNRDGSTFLDRGIDTVGPKGARPLLRTLALLGFGTVAMLVYYVPMTALTPYGDAYPKGYPSYMINGMCGPGTHYACPGPGVPIVGP
jgi:hypothetical protein